MCHLLTFDPLRIRKFSQNEKEARNKLIVTGVCLLGGLFTLTLFGLCIRAIKQGTNPIGLTKMHAVIWAVLGVPVGTAALINLLALPFINCSYQEQEGKEG